MRRKKLVISQSPYRISLGGGGTDLPFYFKERGGRLISATINQYVKVTVAPRVLDNAILVQTTDTQFVDNIDKVDHVLVREALRYFKLLKAVQVATFTTIPSGIGLGTSSTVMVGLVNALATFIGQTLSPLEIGFLAHYIERDILELPGGIQDQYISALGGIQILNVSTSGEVTAQPLFITEQKRKKLERGLVLIYTSKKRDSCEIVQAQKQELSEKTFEVYDRIKELGDQSITLLQNADIIGLGQVMDEHWHLKKTLSKNISNDKLDVLYTELKSIGSPGGKIIGAGGGGFFMMAVPSNVGEYTRKLDNLGYSHLDWCFEFKGSHIIDVIH